MRRAIITTKFKIITKERADNNTSRICKHCYSSIMMVKRIWSFPDKSWSYTTDYEKNKILEVFIQVEKSFL